MNTKTKQVKSRRQFTAMEKVQAILSVWAERRKPAEVCRELQIRWVYLNNWQNKALTGMLKALETGKDTEKVPALGERLRKLLDRQIARRDGRHSKLQQRLEKIQQDKEEPSPAKK